MTKKKNIASNLITSADLENDAFGVFKNDKERIKYMKAHYGNMSLAKSFAIFYGEEISPEIKSNKNINSVINITIGELYSAEVEEFDSNGIVFKIPGVKEEVISKETFSDCRDAIDNYLLNHNNKLLIEVREKKNGKYYVSVINAYYRAWQNAIEKAITQENGINVHIDSLTRGGYLCHTSIWTLNELTGKNYTSSVFIPGSHIVLNIENDFERWLDKDVIIVPQKFAKYRSAPGQIENSIVGSRKRTLQIEGTVNLHNIWMKQTLAEKNPTVKYEPETFDGVVTGIINSNKITGVFIELSDQYITGLLPVSEAQLLNYKPGDPLKVQIDKFEVKDGKEPWVIKNNKIVKCSVRPVFKLSK